LCSDILGKLLLIPAADFDVGGQESIRKAEEFRTFVKEGKLNTFQMLEEIRAFIQRLASLKKVT
jgi:hypothetical protein